MHAPRILARFALVVCLAIAGAGCRRAEGPNIVFVTFDTTRADRIGPMGHAAAKTPVLDALAKRGTVFERAYASAPITLPSHATLLSGLEPPAHTVHDNGLFVVPSAVETVAELLLDRGYATAAFVSAFVLDKTFGLDQGFEVYDSETALERNALLAFVPRRDGDKTVDAALAWLEKRDSRPYFLWLHLYDVHVPRIPPAPYSEMPDGYDAAIAFEDAQLGRLLAGVEKQAGGRETLVVVTADHGEGLNEHYEFTHGSMVYDSTMHVPLVIAGPGFAAGARSQRFVRSADVAATLAAAAGLSLDPKLETVALQAKESAEPASRFAYFETFLPTYNFGWSPLAGVRDERWKLTAMPEPIELYDVLADPRETKNLAATEGEVVARLQAEYEKRKVDLAALENPPESADAEVSEKLAALGYVSAPQSFSDKDRPDPRTSAWALSLIEHGRALALAGQVSAAVTGLERLAAMPAFRSLALNTLGPMYLTIGRYDDAIAAFRELAATTGTWDHRLDVADALLTANRAEEALRELDAIAAGAPGVRLELLRAQALISAGRFAEAEEVAAAVVAREPANDRAIVTESSARIAAGGPEAIRAEGDRLRALLRESKNADRLPGVRFLLAKIAHEAGNDKEAVALLEGRKERPLDHLMLLSRIAKEKKNYAKATELAEEIVRRQPSNQVAMLELADLYDQQNRIPEALALYDRMIAVNPGDATLYVDRGSFRARQRDAKGAEADYRKALEIDDKLPEADFNLAIILIAQGKDDEAEKLLLKAVEMRPDYAKAHFHLARIYRDRKDPRAQQHAERAVGGRPDATGPSS